MLLGKKTYPGVYSCFALVYVPQHRNQTSATLTAIGSSEEKTLHPAELLQIGEDWIRTIY